MDTIIKLTGIFSEIVVFGILFYCFFKAKKFHSKKETFSHFGSIKTTARIFKIGLLFYLVVRAVFVFKVIDYFQLWNNLLIISSYVIAMLSIFLAALFTVREYELIHFIVSRIAVITSIFFLITFSVVLMYKNYYLGMFSFIIFLSLLAVSVLFVLRKKTNAIFQIYFFIPILLWDWVITLKLLNVF